MTLPAIYISLHLSTVILFFIKRNWTDKYREALITSHLILFSVLLLDIFVINLKGVWLDRIIVVAFLLTASMTFAIYRKTLSIWQKIYFGFFLFYPLFAAATFLMDRIFFVIVAAPLLVTLTVPETKFSDAKYELREIVGAMAPVQLALVEKGLVTEKHLGTSNDEQIMHSNITDLQIVRQKGGTTYAVVKTGNKSHEIAFYK